MTTLYITHDDFRLHEMGPGHPECPGRLVAISDELEGSGLLADLRTLQAPLAEAADLERVHDPRYVESIFRGAPAAGYRQLDPDTAMNPHSLDAARRAAGAGILAVDELLAGRARNAFCAVRPCGHHATPARSMGFCIFNNVAVAAAHALGKGGLQRHGQAARSCGTLVVGHGNTVGNDDETAHGLFLSRGLGGRRDDQWII